ncbi:MAG TPA: hypothetical protein VGB46_08025 [Flavisolibacter sp.]|jgi:hypothetical protein
MRLHIPVEPRIKWDSPISDYDILTLEACKLIFDQSRTYFEETIQESEELTQRSMRMLFLFLPAIAAIIGYCISYREKFQPLQSFDFMLIIAVSGGVSNCVFNLFKLISPKEGYYRGSKPQEVMRPELFRIGRPEKVEKALYISEIERYQIKIEQMEIINYKRIFLYQEVIYSFNAVVFVGILLLIRSI